MSPVATTTDFKTSLNRLRGIGVSKAWLLRHVLPEWWDDAIADTPMGMNHFHLMVSRALGLSLRDLANPEAPLGWPASAAKLKASARAQNADLDPSLAVAVQVARVVANCMPAAKLPLAQNALALRSELLVRGVPWLDLERLVEAAWDRGIAVVHLGNLPKGAGWAKPDGMAMIVKGRRVIVLCSAKAHPAWQLFDLAHELGHHASGHVEDAQGALSVIVDVALDRKSEAAEEREADRFALELLCGDPARSYKPKSGVHTLYAKDLAPAATVRGRAERVDPGHIILNYANTMSGSVSFATASAALKLLPPTRSAQQIIQAAMNRHLDWSMVGEESASFVQRLTSPASEPA